MTDILKNILPTPEIISCEDDFIKPDIDFIACEAFENAVDAFLGYADKLEINEGSRKIFIKNNADIPSEGWRMCVNTHNVTVYASDECGAQHAMAALLQILYSNGGQVPVCELKSAPDCEYRSVMIDLARDWHEFHYLKEYVDMCWLYGLKYLHLHFTDDQSYTLPSKLFPKLSTEGRHYTFEQLAELSEYANACGVSLIPEIDVPGHSTPFAQTYPDVFGNYGIISQTEKSMDAMQGLFAELCDMFPYSEYIHIGGDEAAIIRWTEHEECRNYAEKCGIDFDMEDKRLLSERFLANFVQKMADVVEAKGKKAVAWEGFGKCVNDFVSRNITIFSWENFYQITPDLLDAGFKIINSSWNPTYIVAPDVFWSLENVYDWSIYRWTPVHGGSPYAGTTLEIKPDKNVIGGQLQAWGDRIAAMEPDKVEDGVKLEQKLVFDRAQIISERTWNTQAVRTKEEFIPHIAVISDMLYKMIK